MLKSFLNSLPPLFVLVIVLWSYYSYVVEFCIFLLDSTIQKSLYIATFNIMLLMFAWTFLESMCKFHYPISDDYRLGDQEHARLSTYDEEEANQILKKIISSRRLDIYTCSTQGRIRYCKICMLIKPDRTHHCNTCAKCILKMDHHCPWVANCVGYYNYKHFVLMLFYAMVLCGFYVATVAEYIVEIWKEIQTSFSKVAIGIGFLLVACTGMMVGILFFYHVNLICQNQTTIEALRDTTFREDNTTFSLGRWSNITEVCGENVCCWFFPIHTGRGNGYEFNVKNLV